MKDIVGNVIGCIDCSAKDFGMKGLTMEFILENSVDAHKESM